jgi:hypothetical protein
MDRGSLMGEALWIGCVLFCDQARLRARDNKITFSQPSFNMKDVTVPLSGEVFLIESLWRGSGKGSMSSCRHSPVFPFFSFF